MTTYEQAVELMGATPGILGAGHQARAENLALLRGLTPDRLARTGRHPRYGTLTVRAHAVEWAYRDRDHLRPLLAAPQAALYPDLGPVRALDPPPA